MAMVNHGQKLNAALTALAVPLAASSVDFHKNSFAEKKNLRVFTEKLNLTFKAPSGELTTLQVKPWETIKKTKRMLAEMTAPKGFGLLIDMDELVSKVMRQRLFFQGQVLKDNKSFHDYNIQDGDVIYRLAEQSKPEASAEGSRPIVEPSVQVVLGPVEPSPELMCVIDGCREGLLKGLAPVLASSGLGGTYFLRDASERVVAVFKPEDEEAYAPNNPRGLASKMGTRGLRNGLLSGEANLREVAAYLLDHEHFANVPATVRVEITHATFGAKAKVGSLQEFKPHDDEAGDVSASLFTVEGAHRIAIMDMRLLNRDRNDENLLVKKEGKSCELIPIDHGCSLPDSFEVNWHDWAWLSWPQTKQPLRPAERAYIARLNAEEDARILTKELSIRWQCLLVLRISTLFLQMGAAADLSLYDIASMMSRDENENPSTLEVVFAQAKTLAESRRRGGKPKRRSPQASPNFPGQATPPSPKLKRSASCVSLDFDAFKLPGVVPGITAAQAPADDCSGWVLSDSNEEIFDESFWTYFMSLMQTAIQRRKMKRDAIEQLRGLVL